MLFLQSVVSSVFPNRVAVYVQFLAVSALCSEVTLGRRPVARCYLGHKLVVLFETGSGGLVRRALWRLMWIGRLGREKGSFPAKDFSDEEEQG